MHKTFSSTPHRLCSPSCSAQNLQQHTTSDSNSWSLSLPLVYNIFVPYDEGSKVGMRKSCVSNKNVSAQNTHVTALLLTYTALHNRSRNSTSRPASRRLHHFCLAYNCFSLLLRSQNLITFPVFYQINSVHTTPPFPSHCISIFPSHIRLGLPEIVTFLPVFRAKS